MYLTKEEEEIYDGAFGAAKEKAIKVIVKVGEAVGAERLVDIASAHASGLSYNNIGDPGLEFLEEIASSGAKVAVSATLNPIGYDTTKEIMQLPEGFAEKQKRIIDAFVRMGFKPTLSCTPYFASMPKFGEHLAWGESSAVIYANSIAGARSNREGGPLAVFAALVGKTYYAGLHIDEMRRPTMLFDIGVNEPSDVQASMLGLKIGEIAKDGLPYIRGIRKLSMQAARLMLAAMAASGSVGMALIEGVSPEAKNAKIDGLEKISIEGAEARAEAAEGPSDLYYIGCPHASIDEIKLLASISSGKKVGNGKRFWVTTGSDVYAEASRLGIASQLLESGIEIIVDTCPVVAPLSSSFKSIATNSGKSLFYLSKVHGSTTRIMSIEDLVKEATS